MTEILLNKKLYKVNPGEFEPIHTEKYYNLQLYNDVSTIERIGGLLNELSTLTGVERPNILLSGIAHGGLLADEVKAAYRKVYLSHKDLKDIHVLFIQERISSIHSAILGNQTDIIVVSRPNYILDAIYPQRYTVDQLDYCIYLPKTLKVQFEKEFGYYIETPTPKLNYNNLIHLTMIVKNAGPTFEQVLIKNLPYIDKWTILDTGSTDDTVDVITRVLVGKKKGTLYQEPFINFKDSRNRCIELALLQPEPCKYLIMLDDTYVINGNLRGFLEEIRSDQYGDSLSLFIKGGDVEYSSNRIIKSKGGLRYIHEIHEIIQTENNISLCIPIADAWLVDEQSDHMTMRTLERKQQDLVELYKLLEKDPNDSRQLYYLAQTYKCIGDNTKAFEFFEKRVNHPNKGLLQELVDTYFEMGRLSEYHLGKNWSESKEYYDKAHDLYPHRADSSYFLGIHYILNETDKDLAKAYEYLSRAFRCGYHPENDQYSLKPTLYYNFLPLYLMEPCYTCKDFELGKDAAMLFLQKRNDPSAQDADYRVMLNWYELFEQLTRPTLPLVIYEKPLLVFCVDGNWSDWTGKNILTKGLGGSETCIVELARRVREYKVLVFCKCARTETFEDVEYIPIQQFHTFIRTHTIDTVIVSRYFKYIADAIDSASVKKVYLYCHDLIENNCILPTGGDKLRGIFCLSQFHRSQFLSVLPLFESRVIQFPSGVSLQDFIQAGSLIQKVLYRFIYTSFPNRGLLPLLQMWPRIKQRYPQATLHVYTQLDNEWISRVWGDGILEIKRLLNEYSEGDLGVTVMGWVSKQELIKGWSTSHIWFYPCTFEETFCLSALEAAASKTLIITTDTGALVETVHSGVKIHCESLSDPMEPEWQTSALEVLFNTIDNKGLIHYLITDNYNNVLSKGWNSRAKELEKILS